MAPAPAPEVHRGRHAVVTRAETERGVRPEAGLESVPAHPADRGLPVVANRAHFPGLDGLRAIAAVMVIFTHVADATGSYSSTFLGAFFARMDAGVAVFFVLSGFLLYRPFVVAHFAGLAAARAAAVLVAPVPAHRARRTGSCSPSSS